MDEKKSFSASMEALLKGMESFVSSKTVVGEPVKLDDAIILPLVDVSFGCAAGSADGSKKGSAGGVNGKITPSAILVIQNGTTKLVSVKNTDNVSRIIDMVPDLVNRFTTGKEKKVTVSDDAVREAAEQAE